MIYKQLQKNYSVILMILIFFILPFIILSFFNHPQNDDYVYAARAKMFGFAGANVWWFNVWSGRYVTTALLSMSPLVFESFFIYKFVAAAIILLLCLALMALVREMTLSCLTAAQQMVLALMVLALYLYQMPAIAEGIYWMAGAVNYQLGCILLLFLAALIIRLERQPRKKSPALHALAIVLIVATAGTNELAMLLLFEFLFLLLVVDVILNRKLSSRKLVAAIVSLMAALVVTLAPGTQVRYALSNHDLWFSIRSIFAVGGGYLVQWMLTAPILPVAILLTPLLTRLPSRRIQWLNQPFLTIPLFLLTYFAMYFPSFYGSGIMEPRTVTVIYLFFLIGFFINEYIILNYFIVRRKKQAINIPVSLSSIAALVMIVQFIAFDSNVKSAWSDLLTGTAYRYNGELNERYEAIDACGSFICEVDPLRDKPAVIYYFENAVDENSDSDFFLRYKDNGYAAYFHKWRIRLKHHS